MLSFTKHVCEDGISFWWTALEREDPRVTWDIDGSDYGSSRMVVRLKSDILWWLMENLDQDSWDSQQDGNEVMLYLDNEVDIVAFQLVWG
ncbi:MAG: hypothetical protein EOP83_27470 [Verrucomicrobiaceae bacterium]|nr:MAG: hypothetical protein EOP83_27470 [Verrucomicrobiaceae bacterium]